MRWFRHFSDTRHNPKFHAIDKKFGEAGYARAFKLLEVIASRSDNPAEFYPRIDLRNPSTSLDWLADMLQITPESLEETLAFFAEVRFIDPKSWRKKIVYVPQMVEYLDEWTRRQQRTKRSGATPFQSR